MPHDDMETQLAAAMQGIPLEQARLQQRMRRAQGLMETPLPQGQQMGRIYRAASPLEALATALSRGLGARDMRQADQEWGGLAQRAEQAGLARMRQERSDKERGFGLQERGLARQEKAEASEAQRRAEQTKLDRERLGIERERVGQESWAFGQDPTGGGVMYNRKTGEVMPIRPQGALPGQASGLKPQQFESDVQSLGKDMEDLTKLGPDVEQLQGFARMADQPGFGPLAGRVPNFLASDEAVKARQAAGRYMANYIHAVSGAVANENEVARLLAARGLGQNATPAQFRNGVAQLTREYQDLVRSRTAKYHPSVVETFKARGGGVTKPSGDAPKRIKVDAEGNIIP